MNAFLALFRRELRRRRAAFAVALAGGLVGVALPWLPGTHATSDAELRGVAAAGAALLWALLLALLEGATCLATDLRERRLAYDFRLPVAGFAIWVARVGAALVSVFGGALLVAAPAAIARADLRGALLALDHVALFPTGVRIEHPLLFLKVAILAIFFSANFLGLALASRSGATLAAAAGVVGFKVAAFAATGTLWRATAERATGDALFLAFALGGAGLLAASVAQVTVGRTEPDRAQRAFTRVWLVSALVASAALLLWSHAKLTPSPRALAMGNIAVEPISRDLAWIDTEIPYEASSLGLLVAPSTGEVLARNRTVATYQRIVGGTGKLSADGRTFARLEMLREGTRSWSTRLLVHSLVGKQLGEGRETLRWTGVPVAWALSPDGARVATLWRKVEGPTARIAVAVESIADGAIVAATFEPACQFGGPLYFADADRLRVSCGLGAYTHEKLTQWNWNELALGAGVWSVVEGRPPGCRPYDGGFGENCGGDRAPDPRGPRPVAGELSAIASPLVRTLSGYLWTDPDGSTHPLLDRF